jgi:hypothetical protein
MCSYLVELLSSEEQSDSIDQGFLTRVPREIVIEKKTSFFELVGQNIQIHRKISFSTQKSIVNYYWIVISTTY